jgi:hypothetical protein
MVSRSHVLADGPCRNPNPNLAFAEMIARTSHHASPCRCHLGTVSGLDNEKRSAPTGEPPTGANLGLPVRVAQARLRAPALHHKQRLPQAEVLGDQ